MGGWRFCGWGALLAVGTLACAGPDALPASIGGSTSTTTTPGGASTEALGSSTNTSSSEGDLTEGDSDDDDPNDNTFLSPPDDNGSALECSVWEEDCPRGDKCMPAATYGDSWDTLVCVPIVADPDLPGEPCSVQDNPYSGMDTCALHTICWGVDPESLEGTCFAFCSGDSTTPFCEDPDSACPIVADGVVLICLPSCDPVAQDCSEGTSCYPQAPGFACIPNATGDGVRPGEPCHFANECTPGSICINTQTVPGCDAAACCTSVCTIDAPSPECLGGQVCLPYYERGEAPAGYADVGVCMLPEP